MGSGCGSGSRRSLGILRKLASIDLDSVLRSYVERVAREFRRVTIVLFGSRARGEALPYSDYDLAVIFEDLDPSQRIPIVERLYALKPPELPLDALALSVDEVEDPITRRALENCVILYDGLGIASKLPCRKPLNPTHRIHEAADPATRSPG